MRASAFLNHSQRTEASVFKLTALIPTIVGFIVYAISIWANYHPNIRSTRAFWVIGMSAAVVAHGFWSYLAQNVSDQRSVMVYALIWDVGFTLLSVAVPALIFRLPIGLTGYAGIALIV